MGKQLDDEILAVVKELPGITAREIYEFMPHVPKGTVSSAIHGLKVQGYFTFGTKVLPTRKGDREFTTFTLSPNPDPKYAPVIKKRKTPTESGVNAQLEQIKAELAELKAWKDMAIARYPDLLVDSTVLKARKIVAAELKAAGDCNLAEQVLAGKKDETMLVKVTARALEEVDA